MEFFKRNIAKIRRAIKLPKIAPPPNPPIQRATRPAYHINRHFSVMGTDNSGQPIIIFKPATSHWMATIATYEDIPADNQKPEPESWRSWPWTNLPGSENFKDPFEYFAGRESCHSEMEEAFWDCCVHPNFEAQELWGRLIAAKEGLRTE
ncbi:hypothetical protein K440DRAFT_640791 [Wilcoxina mikolae CBS 423.85]|nr:hypothetical protein K440DRAFT_640791 [Wilcoxina mikolae CBS 423.85]